jgi:very-short-patch-repair endonuclease
MTHAERILWERVRNRQLNEFKFRRQQIIEGFIADFFCEAAKLAVEVDGAVHDTNEQRAIDIQKEQVFKTRGILLIRFSNDKVENDIDSVLGSLLRFLKDRCL